MLEPNPLSLREQLGKIVLHRCKHLGFTQAQLAVKLGTNPQQISRMVKGHPEVGLGMFEKAFHHLGLDLQGTFLVEPAPQQYESVHARILQPKNSIVNVGEVEAVENRGDEVWVTLSKSRLKKLIPQVVIYPPFQPVLIKKQSPSSPK
ncbi:MAG TPA: hypothetical protein DCE41_04675 [Cytophagales bacterium]|nr:hypothetical protein [Cytophagales bacterium]HAA23096.1 hypothetical protein [Cytophagales bacterium]HAP64293.1 hypothetical protein [Cytophagales bacterium]